MKSFRIIIFIIIGLIQVIYSQAPATLAGIISDDDDGKPVYGARVKVLGTGFSAFTDSSGIYSMVLDMPEGYYRVEITAPGYQHRVMKERYFNAGQAYSLNIALAPTAVGMNTVIMRSASHRPENVLAAPVTASVINAASLRGEMAFSPDILLQNVPGADIAATGIDRREITLRGFNAAFNPSPYLLADFRQASLPSLGVNLYASMPLVLSDIYRIEMLSDPASALYGPGGESGVVHFISKNPFTHPGLALSIGGGERSARFGTLRGAASIGGVVGFKITGQYAEGRDWEWDSDDHFDEQQLDADAPGVERRYDYKKMNANAQLQFKIGSSARITANGGLAVVKENLLTPLGTAYADSLVHSYGQVMVQAGRFFAQGYMNRITAGQLFLYGLDTSVADQSQQARGQAQYDFHFSGGRLQVLAGSDVKATRPQTGGSIYGRNEENDEVQEIGGYLHSLYKISPRLDFTLALRGDYNDLFEEVRISPRGALVYKLHPAHFTRLTFNQAVSMPAYPSLFLDFPLRRVLLNQTGGYELILQGRGASRGFTFNGFHTNREVAVMAALPDLQPNPFGDFVPLDEFPVALGYLNTAQAAGALFSGPESNIPPDLRRLDAEQRETLVQLLELMGREALKSGETAPGILGLPDNSALGYEPVSGPRDVPALKMPSTQTLEAGYKGLVKNRFLVGINAFYAMKKNFVSPLLLETPFVYLPEDYVREQVLDFITSGDPAVEQLIRELGIGPVATVGLMTHLYSQTPSGIVQPDPGEDGSGVTPVSSPTAIGGLLTYRNFGKVQYWGFDIDMQYMPHYYFTLFWNLSFISDDFFDNKELKETHTELSLALNAPTFKTKFGVLYHQPKGWSLGVSGRYVRGFPVQSGPYLGGLPEPYGTGRGGVEQYIVFDVNVGRSLGKIIPGLRLDVTVNNLFDFEHREFVGAPKIGRLALAQLNYSL